MAFKLSDLFDNELEKGDISKSDRSPKQEWPRAEHIINSIDVAEKYYNQYTHMAFKATKSFRRAIGFHGFEYDDYYQITLMGLWCAALTYNGSSAFSSWLYMVSRHLMSRELNRKYINGLLNTSIKFDGDVEINDITDYNRLSFFDKLIVMEIIEMNYKVNPQREADILIERLVWDMTLEECAIKRSLTRERIRQLESRALSKLKNVYRPGSVKFLS